MNEIYSKSSSKLIKMSRRISKNICKDSKQAKLTAFITNKSNETSPGIKRHCKILMNVFVNVNLKSRIGKKSAKTMCFVSAVPDNETRSVSSEPHSSTSAAVCAENVTIDSKTVNVNVTLNVTTTDTEVEGK